MADVELVNVADEVGGDGALAGFCHAGIDGGEGISCGQSLFGCLVEDGMEVAQIEG